MVVDIFPAGKGFLELLPDPSAGANSNKNCPLNGSGSNASNHSRTNHECL